jgi:hypothetical protein
VLADRVQTITQRHMQHEEALETLCSATIELADVKQR